MRRPRADRGLAAHPRARRARRRRLARLARGQLLRSLGRRGPIPTRRPRRGQHPGARRSGRGTERGSPLPRGDAIPLDSPLVPEVSGGPVLDAAGRLVGHGARQDGGDAPACSCRGDAIQRAPERAAARAARASTSAGRDQYRCVAAPARLRAGHAPGLPAARRQAERADPRRPGCPARRAWTGMSATADGPASMQHAPALGDRRSRRSRWLVVLVAPAAVGAAHARRAGGSPSEARCAPGALPTDVAVHGLDRVGGQRPRQPRRGARRPRAGRRAARPPDRRRRRCGWRSATARCGRPTPATTRSRGSIRSCPAAAGAIPVGADAVDVAVSPDGAWVTNGSRGTVTRIDPISNRVSGPPVRTGSFPTALADRRGLRVGRQRRRRDRRARSTRARTS